MEAGGQTDRADDWLQLPGSNQATARPAQGTAPSASSAVPSQTLPPQQHDSQALSSANGPGLSPPQHHAARLPPDARSPMMKDTMQPAPSAPGSASHSSHDQPPIDALPVHSSAPHPILSNPLGGSMSHPAGIGMVHASSSSIGRHPTANGQGCPHQGSVSAFPGDGLAYGGLSRTSSSSSFMSARSGASDWSQAPSSRGPSRTASASLDPLGLNDYGDDDTQSPGPSRMSNHHQPDPSSTTSAVSTCLQVSLQLVVCGSCSLLYECLLVFHMLGVMTASHNSHGLAACEPG